MNVCSPQRQVKLAKCRQCYMLVVETVVVVERLPSFHPICIIIIRTIIRWVSTITWNHIRTYWIHICTRTGCIRPIIIIISTIISIIIIRDDPITTPPHLDHMFNAKLSLSLSLSLQLLQLYVIFVLLKLHVLCGGCVRFFRFFFDT